jgi:RND family efflux transporter MFP subunit
MKKKSGLLWLVILILVGVLSFIGFKKIQSGKTTPSNTAPANVASNSSSSASSANTILEIKPSEIFTLTEQNLRQTIGITGTIKAVQSAFVKVKVPGEILDLQVREGDAVKAGQVLGKIDNTESIARLKQAQQQAASAKAQLDIAQRQLDNNQALMSQGFISKTALDNASSSMAGAKASYQAALEGVNLAQKSLADTNLKAPISGVISQKLAQTGERLSLDTRVYEIVNLSSLELEASLPITDAQNIRVGQTAKLKIDSTAIQNLEAKVTRINPSVQAGSRSVLIYLSVANHPALKHGLFAQGQIEVGQRSALVVPVSAVRTDKPAPYVQVIEGNTVKHQKVVPGERGELNDMAVVEVTGLAPNTQVLAPTLGIVREGTAIRVLGSTSAAGK